MTFDLTNEEANLIAAALSKHYEIVVALLNKLQSQAAEQLKPPAPAAEPAKE